MQPPRFRHLDHFESRFAHAQQTHLAQIVEVVFVQNRKARLMRSSAAAHSSSDSASIASNNATA